MKQAATNTDQLISGKGCTIPRWAAPSPPIPVEVDPPMHRHYRRLLVPELRPEAAEKWAGRIAEVTDKVIDRFIESGEGDLREIANTVPPAIIASILGSPDDAKAMVSLTHDLNEAAMSGDLERKKAANMAVFGLTDRIVTEAENAGPRSRRPGRPDRPRCGQRGGTDHPPEGGVDHRHPGRRRPRDHRERDQLDPVAGRRPPPRSSSSCSTIRPCWTRPWRRRCGWSPPVQLMGRTATQDMDLFGGVQIKEGDAVGLTWGRGQHRPGQVREPPASSGWTAATTRTSPSATASTAASGEHLARVEMKVTLQRVLERMPDYELNGDVVIGANIDQNRGALTVPVKFTAGAKLYANA